MLRKGINLRQFQPILNPTNLLVYLPYAAKENKIRH